MSQAAYKAMFGFLCSILSGESSSEVVGAPFVGFEVIPLLNASKEPLAFHWQSMDLKIIAGLRAMAFTDASLKAISKAALRDLWGRLFGLLRADFDKVESLRGRILVTKAELHRHTEKPVQTKVRARSGHIHVQSETRSHANRYFIVQTSSAFTFR
jgi:hypothetical protein